MKAKKSGPFTIKPVTVKAHGFTYETFQVSGWLNGRRIRKHFKSRAEALGEKNALEVEAANVGGEIRSRNTRLSSGQLAEAESAFARLAGRSLSLAVEWFISTFRPPVTEMPLATATGLFEAARKPHVRPVVLRDYKNTFKLLNASFPNRAVHAVSTAEIQAFLSGRHVGPKRFNNLRGDLHALFAFASAKPQEWRCDNPVTPIEVFKITRDVPKIMSADTIAAMMAYLEAYAGGSKGKHPAGCLVPYFALATFAGLRPSIPDGEICKLAAEKDVLAFVKLDLGVIKISPRISKTKDVRQIDIQPNLMEWLLKYPLNKFPIKPPNARRMIQHVREKFQLSDDVLRHTFISMHVAKFRSLGDTALQAGNSETMIKKHYLNTVTPADAEKFWFIKPRRKSDLIISPFLHSSKLAIG